MIRNSPGFWHISITSMIFFGLLNAGCISLESFTSQREERIDTVENNVDELSGSVEELNVTSNELNEKFDELTLENERLSEVQAQLKDKQAAIESLQKIQKNERKELKQGLLETKSSLQKINHKVAIIESDKNKIKEQMEELTTLYTQSIKAKKKAPPSRVVAEKKEETKKEVSHPKANIENKEKAEKLVTPSKDVAKKTNVTGKSRESAIKETQEKLKSNLVEELLNKAIVSYREGKFEAAITKWEEALALDPGKLEAMFNIEIAQDKIKEKQKSLGK